MEDAAKGVLLHARTRAHPLTRTRTHMHEHIHTYTYTHTSNPSAALTPLMALDTLAIR